MKHAATLSLLLLGAACATQPRTMLDFAPLSAAFVTPVNDLQARASGGDAEAQYAMSMLARHGLRGVPKNEDAAKLYRLGATMQRGMSNIPVYVPGVNGAPGSTTFVAVTIYGMDLQRATAFDDCIAALLEGDPADACGDADVARMLQAQFVAATAASTPLP